MKPSTIKQRVLYIQRDVMLENQGFKDVNPLICGEERCASGHCFGPAIREYYLLHFVVSGRGTLCSPRGCFPVEKGQIFVIFPGEVNTYTADLDDPWHYIWIGFSSTLPLEDVFDSDVLDAPECAHIFDASVTSDQVTVGRELYVCGKIFELLSQIRMRSAPAPSRCAQYVSMAKNYILTNYMQELSVSQIAVRLNLNRSYFCQIFKRITGKSPKTFIVDHRLNRAAEMIATHAVTPGDAARLCGYTDSVNFSRMFHRKFGLSPSAYRTATIESRFIRSETKEDEKNGTIHLI